jgi:hypothetical protein
VIEMGRSHLALSLLVQLLQEIKKAIEAMNPVFSVREDSNALHVSFPKYVGILE